MHIYWSFRALILLVKDPFFFFWGKTPTEISGSPLCSVSSLFPVLIQLGHDLAIGSVVSTWAEQQDQSPGILSLFCVNSDSNRKKRDVLWTLGQPGSCKFCIIYLLKFVTFQTCIQVIMAWKNEADESHIS